MTPQRRADRNGQKNQSIGVNNHTSLLPGLPPITLLLRPAINHCEPGWNWTPPPFRDFDLWIVLAGHGALRIGNSEVALTPGACVIFQPGDTLVEARHDPANPLVVFYCHFIPGKAGSSSRRLCKEIIHVVFERTTHLREGAELVAEVFEQGEAGQHLAAMTVAQLVSHVLFVRDHPRGQDSGHSRLSKLALDIRSRPGSSWAVKEMAEKCALSPAHFNRRFRQIFGSSPIQYVIRQRILRATTLLQESDLSLQQIADSVGYNDVFFFHRQFRQITGTTPRAIRAGAPGAQG